MPPILPFILGGWRPKRKRVFCAVNHRASVRISAQENSNPRRSPKNSELSVVREMQRKSVYVRSSSQTPVDRKSFHRTKTKIRIFLYLRQLLLAVMSTCAIYPQESSADFVAFNGAEVAPNIAVIRIENDAVRIALEVYPDELSVFEDVLPDSWMPEGEQPRASEADRLAQFAQNGFSVSSSSEILPLSVARVAPGYRTDRASPMAGQKNPLTGLTVPAPPTDPRVVIIELVYEFTGLRPETLTFRSPAENGTQLLSIGMLLFDRGVPVSDFRFMPQEVSLEIDWDDPWFTRFEIPTFRRTQRDGIATFLYVEPREVRHETLIRVREVAPMLGFALKAGEELSPEHQAELADATADLFHQSNAVAIDGETNAATTANAEILELGERGFRLVKNGQTVLADAAFIGVVLSFPVDSHPQRVDVAWDLFGPTYQQVPATIYDAAGPFISGASPEDPNISWVNHLLTYQEPNVSSVTASDVPVLTVPTVSLLIFVIACGMAFLCQRKTCWSRPIGLAIGLVGILSAYEVRELMVVTVANPFTGNPDETVVQSAVEDLLASVSASYLFPEPTRRAQALEAIITPSSLSDVSAELDRGFAVKVPGGGLAKFGTIEDLSIGAVSELDRAYGFQTIAAWSAEARGGHWGHDHRRRLDFRALVDVVAEDGLWKIDGLTVLQARSPDA